MNGVIAMTVSKYHPPPMPDEWDILGQRIALACRQRRWDEAREILARAHLEATGHDGCGPDDPLDRPLASTGLSVRLVEMLEKRGVLTVSDALGHSRAWYLLLPGFGVSSLAALVRCLESIVCDCPLAEYRQPPACPSSQFPPRSS